MYISPSASHRFINPGSRFPPPHTHFRNSVGALLAPRRDLILGLINLVRFGDSLAVMPDDDFVDLRARLEPVPEDILVLTPTEG